MISAFINNQPEESNYPLSIIKIVLCGENSMKLQSFWKKELKADPTDWLLEPDDPGVRYLALRDIVDAGETEIKTARRNAHRERPIARILAGQRKTQSSCSGEK